MAAKKDGRPSRDQAEEAVRTLLLWAGEDPGREGLADTPKRVAYAYEDWFSGYKEAPDRFLKRTFEEVDGYDEMSARRSANRRIVSAARTSATCQATKLSASASWLVSLTHSRDAFRCRKK